jgi:hypothetical protein
LKSGADPNIESHDGEIRNALHAAKTTFGDQENQAFNLLYGFDYKKIIEMLIDAGAWDDILDCSLPHVDIEP